MAMQQKLETLMYLHLIGGFYLLVFGTALFRTSLLLLAPYVLFGLLNLYVVWKIWAAQIGDSTWIGSLLGIAFGLGSSLLLAVSLGLGGTSAENGTSTLNAVTTLLAIFSPGLIIFGVQAYKFYLDLPKLRSLNE